MHHFSNLGKGISDLIGTSKNKPEPDGLMVKCKQQLADLHDDISVVQRQFKQYAEQVVQATEASVTLSRSVGQFYSKADHPGRSESVSTYRKVQEEIANRAVKTFHITVENGLVAELTEWSGLISSLMERIDNAETTNNTAHDTKNRLISLQKELEDKRDRASKGKKQTLFGGSRKDDLEDLEQRISEASDAAASLSKEYQKLRKGIAQSVKQLMEKKFMYFDRIYVQMLECQTEYFQSAAKTTKRFQRDIDYYRKQYPKATNDFTHASSNGSLSSLPDIGPRHNGVGSGSGFATRQYSQSLGGGNARNSKLSASQPTSPQSSPVPDTKPNGKARPKPPSQRPPSYKEHQERDSHAQSLRNGLGSATASMTASHTQSPVMSGTTSPTPAQSANGATTQPVQESPVTQPAAAAVEHHDILGMDFSAAAMSKPKKAERQSSTLNRLFGGDDVSASAVHDEFGINNIHEPHPDDLIFGGGGEFRDSNANNGQAQGTGDVFDGFDDMFTGATSNPQSPLKAPAQSSMHGSADSLMNFMSGDSSSQPTEAAQGQGGSRKKNSQSLDDQMDSVFNAPSYQNNHQQHQRRVEEAAPVVKQSRSPQRSPNARPISEADKIRAATMELSAAGKARAQEAYEREMKARDAEEKKANREMAERTHWKDTHEAKLRQWEFDNEVRRNIRVLIQHLPDVLPDELKWKPIPLSKLLNDAQLKKGYFKAVRVVHPDKSQQRGDSIETQVICDFVFQALEMAYNTKFG